MKLAEALMERKSIKKKMEELKKRIYQNALIQEGDTIVETPEQLLDELKNETDQFEALVIRINKTNNIAKVSEELTLMEAIVKKDMLNFLHFVQSNLADKATPANDRYSQREIKIVPTIDITETRKKADLIAKAYRKLDVQIQECNWTTELI